MAFLRGARGWWFGRDKPAETHEVELDEEVRSHLAMLEEDFRHQGMDTETAAARARATFGAVDVAKEGCRDEWSGATARRIGRLGRIWMRMVSGDAAGAGLIIAALALGIGLVTTTFACVESYLFRGLPFPDGERMFHLTPVDRHDGNAPFTMPLRDYSRYRAAAGPDIEAMMAFDERTVSFRAGDGLPRRCASYIVPANFTDFLGVQPIVGPGFAPGDAAPGGRAVLLISHRLWQQEFAGDPDVIGRMVVVDGAPWTVVGVMGENFRFIRDNDVWFPERKNSTVWEEGGDQGVIVCARVRRGADLRQVAAQLGATAVNLAREFPETNSTYHSIRLTPLHHAVLGSTTVKRLWTMQAFAFLVLLIGCSNASSLLATRFSARRKEMAVRTALGGTPAQLIAQIVGESLLFALAGAMGGFALAAVGIKLLWLPLAPFAPYWVEPFRLGPATLGFVVIVTALAGLGAGLGPAVHVSRVSPAEILKDDQRTGAGVFLRRFNTAMVGVQVAVSFALLVGSGLMVRAVQNMKEVGLPFEPGRIVTARVILRGYDTEVERAFHVRLREELERSHPELGPVAFTSREGLNEVDPVPLEAELGRAGDGVVFRGRREIISPGFFSVLGVGVIRGREFAESDGPDGMPVAIVNQSLARRLWPGENPLGRRIRLPGEPEWQVVVGLVPDLRQQGMLNFLDAGAGFYRPVSQVNEPAPSVVARPRVPVDDWEAIVRGAVFALDADQAPKDVGTMLNNLPSELAVPRMLAFLLLVFGGVATALAAIGLYGLMSFSVTVRTREFGVRMAFGAVSRDILNLASRQGAGQVLPGLLAGAALACVGGVFLQRAELLGPVAPVEPRIYAATLFIVVLVTVVAIARPVRRATRLQPWDALRQA